MIPTAKGVLEKLVDSGPVHLDALPERPGIYALWDHTGEIRYMGSTPKSEHGLRKRVGKHISGSEGYSHKYSHAYCTGRMWRSSKKLHPAVAQQHDADAKEAKRLRNAVIRAECRATYVEVPRELVHGDYFRVLTDLEHATQSIAPASMRRWEKTFPPLDEPVEIVERVIDQIGADRDRLERQRRLYKLFAKVGNS